MASSNISCMFVTFPVFHAPVAGLWLMGWLKATASQNMVCIVVMLSVFQCPIAPLNESVRANIPRRLVTPVRFGASVAVTVRFWVLWKARSMETHSMSPHCSTVRIWEFRGGTTPGAGGKK
jgi:hypothetical protein